MAISWLDENGNLKKSSMLQWVEHLLDAEFRDKERSGKSLFKLSLEGNVYVIKRKRCGPAHTLLVEIQYPYVKTKNFSMDIVVALRLDDSHWVSEIPFETKYWSNNWHAVPKPDSVVAQIGDNEWICSYADIERILIKDRHKMKMLIRIFKVIHVCIIYQLLY